MIRVRKLSESGSILGHETIVSQNKLKLFHFHVSAVKHLD